MSFYNSVGIFQNKCQWSSLHLAQHQRLRFKQKTRGSHLEAEAESYDGSRQGSQRRRKVLRAVWVSSVGIGEEEEEEEGGGGGRSRSGWRSGCGGRPAAAGGAAGGAAEVSECPYF